MESLHRLIIHAQEALSCALLGDLQEHRPVGSPELCLLMVSVTQLANTGWQPPTPAAISPALMPDMGLLFHPIKPTPHLILQVPDTILVGELLVAGTALGQDAALEATHVKQQIGVVLAVNGHEAVLPLHCGD